MARLLIASRSMALALRLADVHQIVEHSPDDLDALQPGENIDAVVLDVGDADTAVRTVAQLREAGYDTPVLLVSGYQPQWAGVPSMGLAGVQVVPLPITRAALLQGIGELTGDKVDPATLPPTPAYGTTTAPAQPPAPEPAGDDASETDMHDQGSEPSPPEEADVESDRDPAGDPHEVVAGDDTASDDGPVAADTDEDSSDDGEESDEGSEGDRSDTDDQPAVTDADQTSTDDSSPGSPTTPPAGTPARGAGSAVPAGAATVQDAPPRAFGSSPATPPSGTWETQPPVPADDPTDWGPPPHRPPSTSHPAAAVPPTPLGGIRRPATNGNGDADRSSPATGSIGLGATEGQGTEPMTGSIGLGRRRNRLPGRLGRNRLGGRVGTSPVTPATGQTSVVGAATETGSPAPPTPFTPAFGAIPAVPGTPDTPGATPSTATDTDPGIPVSQPPGPLTSALEQRLDADAGARTAATVRAGDLVRMLMAGVSELYGVADTAQVLADDVVERADADAAAVLVPDGPVWRVSGGVGLRPLERRLALDGSHWLIAEIAIPGRAVLIEDTDIIRQQLAGAPLAAWRHLLAVPVPDVRAAVVLARGQEAGPFTDRDLTAVVPTVREAATLLTQAIETRRLARTLAPLQENDGEAAPRPDAP